MRIGYYVPPTLLAHEGISARVQATARAWQRLGHEAVLLADPTQPARNALLNHLKGDARAARLLTVEGARLDHVHARLFLPTLQWLRLPPELPLSIEVQSGLRRPESGRDSVRVVLGAFTARALVSRARMGAFITNEFATYPEFRRIATKVVLGNGVELTPPHPAPQNSMPLVGMAIGTLAPWHGVDRFVALALSNPRLRFVLIVPERLEREVQMDITGMPVDVITTDGPGRYEEALSRLDIAVGSMALERKGLREAAPLKVRDYVRAGIPTALAYRDTNLCAVDDDAILQWDGTSGPTFADWAEEQVGARVSEEARQAISIDRIEERRLAAMV